MCSAAIGRLDSLMWYQLEVFAGIRLVPALPEVDKRRVTNKLLGRWVTSTRVRIEEFEFMGVIDNTCRIPDYSLRSPEHSQTDSYDTAYHWVP